MMKRLRQLYILLLLACCTFGVAQDKLRIAEGLSMKSKFLGQEIKYSILLPPDYYTSTKLYPVVYLLHGLGDNESSWLEYGRISQYVDKATRNKDIEPMIFVMPQGFRNYYVNDFAGKFKYEDMFIKELIPFIDKTYRTLANKEHRATMGYSMGGFGALVLALRNVDIFSVSVPLSISVRTDEQYKLEEASGWDDQWGRLFGGIGLSGNDRLTPYYKQHSPFHLLAKANLSKYKNLKLFIDNGDDEYTLSRSNEELHILLREQNFQHEFRVRNGGHDFAYWQSALPNALNFISDSFQNKLYRGDIKPMNILVDTINLSLPTLTKGNLFDIALPNEYESTNRKYPVIYFVGDFTDYIKQQIANKVNYGIENGSLPPVISVFINDKTADIVETILPNVEKNYRARVGFRFRALVGFQEGGAIALKTAYAMPETFTICSIFDAPADYKFMQEAMAKQKKAFERTWLFIATTDKSVNYKFNGDLHTYLRDQEFYHEYRIQQGNATDNWLINNLEEALILSCKKIHR